MWKSTELPIGWIPGSGPGGGAFPFWLAAGMLICCIIIMIRWVAGTSRFSQAKEVYMDDLTIKNFVLVGGALLVLVGLIQVVGVYVSVPLFLIYYIRFLGRHSWKVAGSIAVGIPVFTFFFFEIALKISLPKGVTEPAFYPLYDIFL
jgi:hypothetical protein